MTSTRRQPMETLLHIAQYLAPADLATACQVCRSWFIPFAGELWRSIQQDQWTHGALTVALPRYSVFIQQLRCSRYVSLDQLGPECRQLNLFKTPDITPENVDLIKAILERNQGLEDLELMIEMNKSDIAKMNEILGIVSGMSRLKRLLLDGLMATPEWIEQQVLGGMPQLQTLVLDMYSNTALITDPPQWTLEQHEHGQQPQQAPTKEQPLVMSPLRSLSIDGSDDMLNILARITRLCPELESLSLSETRYGERSLRMSPELTQVAEGLPLQCPRLDQLHLIHNSMDEAGLTCLLRSGFPNLRVFYAIRIFPQTSTILDILIHTPAYQLTLEEVEITKPPFMDRNAASISTMVLQMLKTFPKLRKLSLKRCVIDAEEMVYGARQGDSSESVQDSAANVAASGSEGSNNNDNINTGIRHPSNWVCHDLEILEAIIEGPVAGWAPRGYITRKNYGKVDDDSDYDNNNGNSSDENGDIRDAATSCDERGSNRRRNYDMFYRIKAQLDTLPKLDVSGVTFSHRL
ncbi:hypothetical protein BGZ51_005892 [Haplosporangium sp. Z 767]|nr:hypothetical protein BGZ51_005892 [Haplosporangium sp. Z 767]KAF9184987.1 hypothetical protein BGZ50_003358 [Haplosporangium sp. Z 11]